VPRRKFIAFFHFLSHCLETRGLATKWLHIREAVQLVLQDYIVRYIFVRCENDAYENIPNRREVNLILSIKTANTMSVHLCNCVYYVNLYFIRRVLIGRIF